MLVEACSCKANRRGCKANPVNILASTRRCITCGHYSVVNGECIRRSCPSRMHAYRERELRVA